MANADIELKNHQQPQEVRGKRAIMMMMIAKFPWADGVETPGQGGGALITAPAQGNVAYEVAT